MTSDPDPAPTSNQELLARLQPGTTSSTPQTAPRALLPWELDTEGALNSPASTAGQRSAQLAPVTPPPKLEGTSGLPASLSPSPAVTSAAPPQPGVYPGSDPKNLRYWTGMGWDPRPVAPIWTRVWCYVIDQMLALVAGFAGAILVTLPFSLQDANSEQTSTASVVLALAFLAFIFVSYFAAGYVFWGRTPGMMLGRLHVIDVRSGGRMKVGRAYLRSLILGVQMVSGLLTIIWLVVAVNSPGRQGPHDAAAKSIVLRSA